MTDSQKHRPAVSVQVSEASRLKKQLSRVANLEKQLGNVPKEDDQKSANIRSRLCELFADLLISDPDLSYEKDIAGRLWRQCFYKPLGVFRSNLSREKRKKGPNLAQYEKALRRFCREALELFDYLVDKYQSKLLPPGATGSSQTSESSMSQEEDLTMSPNIPSQSPPPPPPEGSQDESSSPRWPPPAAVVPLLHRLYICSGDLHRYAEAFNKAEQCYFAASKLAPGMGNPYNQLAVMTQLKDINNNCVALYWYSRSFLATHERFETTSGNLDRLFSGNKKYLNEQSRDPKPPILTQNAAVNKNIDKKTAQEMQKAQKTSAIRSSLAHFVDFHYNFYRECRGNDDERQESRTERRKNDDTLGARTDRRTIKEKMADMLESLESLLKASAFGDALLCKLVAITTFSAALVQQKRIQISPSSDDENLTGSSQVSLSSDDLAGTAADDFVFAFAACLAERLAAGLSKLVEKKTGNGNNNSKTPNTIRLLIPLLMLLEYIDNRMASGNDDIDNDKRTQFWKQLSDVANLMAKAAKNLELSVTPTIDDSAIVSVREYRNMKGFHPFGFLFKDYLTREAFVNAAEAADVLELTGTQTQSSNTSSADETQVKVSRFLQLCQRNAERTNVPLSIKSNGVYALSGSTELKESKDDDPMEPAEEPMDDTTGFVMEENKDPVETEPSPAMEMDEDEAGDVVVYNAPVAGDGPALLVPGALVASTPKTARSVHAGDDKRRSPLASVINEKRNPSAVATLERAGPAPMETTTTATNDGQVLPPPPGLLPPPGFGAPVPAAAAPTADGTVPTPGTAQTVYPPIVATPAVGMPPPQNVPMGIPTPQQQFHPTQLFPGAPVGGLPMMAAGLPAQPMYGGAPSNGLTLGHSSEWFGGQAGLKTANPFATPTPANLGLFNTNNVNPVGGFESEATTGEGTSLLDSGLLSSLWGNDDSNLASKTKNPFATNF